MKIKRNEPCPCGSQKKYKKCCMGTENDPAKRKAAPTATDNLNALGPASQLLAAPAQATPETAPAPNILEAVDTLSEHIGDDEQTKKLQQQMQALQSMLSLMQPKKLPPHAEHILQKRNETRSIKT